MVIIWHIFMATNKKSSRLSYFALVWLLQCATRNRIHKIWIENCFSQYLRFLSFNQYTQDFGDKHSTHLNPFPLPSIFSFRKELNTAFYLFRPWLLYTAKSLPTLSTVQRSYDGRVSGLTAIMLYMYSNIFIAA